MAKIGFLGLGAMGNRMVARLVAAGHDVSVWNRSDGRVLPDGAQRAATPAAAAAGAEVVIAMVRDDAASARVWQAPDGALGAMAGGAVGIEVSTVSPEQVRRLHDAAAARALRFVDAPVAGSRAQAEAGQLIFLAGGATEDVAAVEPILLAMGGAVHRAGDAGAGAVVKLMVNVMLATQVAALAELIGLAQAAGVDPGRALAVLGATPVASAAAKGAGAAMLARAFAPAFPIDLVVKDLGLAVDTGATLPMTRAAADVFTAAATAGFGGDNIIGVVQRYL